MTTPLKFVPYPPRQEGRDNMQDFEKAHFITFYKISKMIQLLQDDELDPESKHFFEKVKDI